MFICIPCQGFAKAPLKIALFFSGRVLTYEQQKDWLLTFIEKNFIDVFCSINSDLDDYHLKFIEDFKIKKYHFEIFNVPENITVFAPNYFTKVPNAMSMFYNHKKCMELISEFEQEANIKYDLIIYMRADIVPTQITDFELKEDEFLHVPFGFDYEGGLNDQMAYGSRSVMSMYCSLFDYLDEYGRIYKCSFHPETLLKFHVEHHQIPVERFDFPYFLNHARKP